MPVALRFDPIATVIQAFENLYPGKSTTVTFRVIDDEPAAGFADFSARGKPQVVIDPRWPYISVLGILVHELAHVVAGLRAGHGKKWQAAQSAIHEEYNRLVRERGGKIEVVVDQGTMNGLPR